MVAPRSNSRAILLADGRVLAVGGELPVDQPVASAEVYDPATGTWTATGSMVASRSATHTLTLLPDGTVIAVGGIDCQDCDVIRSIVEVFDPATGSWTSVARTITPRAGHTATMLLDGEVLVAGGADPYHPELPTAELYDPGSRTWKATAGPLTVHVGHTAVLLPDGRVLVTGGQNGNQQSGVAEIYDPGDR